MVYEEEVQIDQEVKSELDGYLLGWDGVQSQSMFGGIAYLVHERPLAILMEGVIGMGLADAHRARALTLAGVSPFRGPPDDARFDRWVQFVLLLPEDVASVVPWLEAAFDHVTSLGPST